MNSITSRPRSPRSIFEMYDCGRPSRSATTEFCKLALDGDYGRALVIGVIVERHGKVALSGCLGRDRQTLDFHFEERRTLASFWKLLKDFDPKYDTIIGHNIRL